MREVRLWEAHLAPHADSPPPTVQLAGEAKRLGLEWKARGADLRAPRASLPRFDGTGRQTGGLTGRPCLAVDTEAAASRAEHRGR